jgi:hypothetical protein
MAGEALTIRLWPGRCSMRNSVLVLCVFIVLAALLMPKILAIVGILGGAILGLVAALGVILVVVFIVALVLSSVGLLTAGVLGLIGVILLAIILPFLAPLLIVIIPVAILIKLIFRS